MTIKWLFISIFITCLISLQMPIYAAAEPALQAAFIRDHNLWIKVNENEKQITNEGQASNPKWSYDGKWVAFTKGEEIWACKVDSEEQFKVFHRGGNYQWAPNRNILAFMDETVLDVSDLRSGLVKGFYNVALGVDSYSWLPDGSGILAAANADLHPDGWTNPILYKIAVKEDLQTDGIFKNVQHFFTLPKEIAKGDKRIIAIGTTSFKWSADRKWIAFIVHPTASWSADSDMLCVLSSDGKLLKPIDEMLDDENWYKWAPGRNLLAYIEGGGRISLGVQNKHVKVEELPIIQHGSITPAHYADIDFTWNDEETITVARVREYKHSPDRSKDPRPSLYKLNINTGKQIRLTHPSPGSGDYSPAYIKSANKLTWIRTNGRQQSDVWVAEPDDSKAKVWIQQINGEINWYDDGKTPAIDKDFPQKTGIHSIRDIFTQEETLTWKMRLKRFLMMSF